MSPPAPGLFSTTTAVPRACCSFGATRRAERSTGPPAAYGTTRWIGRAGHSCASAVAATKAAATKMTGLLFDEHLFALLPDRRQRDDDEQDDRAEHEVAEPHRCDQAPEELRLLIHDLRPRRDALDHERTDHERHHGVRRDAEREHRDEGGLRACVVRRFRRGDALDRALAESFGVL